uniref:Uncharacterized protein n=1 Tax=Dulem virus 42 TaxID=3145760 RepID=A0AAU8BAX8_9CAUD
MAIWRITTNHNQYEESSYDLCVFSVIYVWS